MPTREFTKDELTAEGLAPFMKLAADAYPGMKVVTEEDHARTCKRVNRQNEDPRNSMHGCFRDGKLVGGLRMHDYTMFLRGTNFLAGGAGFLAVDLMHKKEHIAKEMLEYYFQHYLERKAPMAVLWPFRPDFYRKMGVGYGGKIHEYKVKPSDLPSGGTREHVDYLDESGIPLLVECHNRFASTVNGMIEETVIAREIKHEQGKALKWVRYRNGDRIEGYLVFRFEPGNSGSFIDNNLRIDELIYEHPTALAELLTFLHTQYDQIAKIIFDTPDNDFHHLLFDPRNGTDRLIPSVYHESHVSAVGIMYRVLSLPLLFEALKDSDFGGFNAIVRLELSDSFLPENDGEYTIQFTEGHPTLIEGGKPDAEIAMDVADLSSLIIGAVDFRSLYKYSRATISDPDSVDLVNRIFATDHEPFCSTHF